MCDRQKRQRIGAVLVCVMVVLLLVGLISSQAIQTMLIVRQADHRRSGIRQARELIELGRMVQSAGDIPENGQVEVTVDGQRAVIHFESNGTGTSLSGRIVGQLAVDTDIPITATAEFTN